MTNWTIPIWLVVFLLAGHWLADFQFQSDQMAQQKSKSWAALTEHVAVYTCVMAIWTLSWVLTVAPAPDPGGWAIWVGVNGLAHFVTDAVTSRINARLWFIDLVKRDFPDLGEHVANAYAGYTHLAHIRPTRHAFFVLLGFDQLLHGATLVLTAGVWLP